MKFNCFKNQLVYLKNIWFDWISQIFALSLAFYFVQLIFGYRQNFSIIESSVEIRQNHRATVQLIGQLTYSCLKRSFNFTAPTRSCLPLIIYQKICRFRFVLITVKYTSGPNRKYLQEILLDCDQSNVLFARIVFFCIFLSTFSFLSACSRNPASIWDSFNMILIVTGVEVVMENCLPKVCKILPDFRN